MRDAAERGADAAGDLLDRLESRRREALEARATRRAVRRAEQQERTLEGRVSASLDAAGATLRRLRTFSDGTAEVRFGYMHETFVSIIEIVTLRVVDAGICLDGADRVTNLRSLPAVIREAVDTGQLCITSR